MHPLNDVSHIALAAGDHAAAQPIPGLPFVHRYGDTPPRENTLRRHRAQSVMGLPPHRKRRVLEDDRVIHPTKRMTIGRVERTWDGKVVMATPNVRLVQARDPDSLQARVERMTNWQRNQWARATRLFRGKTVRDGYNPERVGEFLAAVRP